MHVLHVDENHPLLLDNLAQAGFTNTVAYNQSKEEILGRIDQFEGLIIRSRFPIDASFLNKATNLKFIGRVGAGLEHIDKEFALEKGIAVLSSPEGNRQAVAEHALGLLLTLFNRINTADVEVRKGLWLRKANEGVELQGITIAIIGFGNTGEAFSRVLSGFQTPVMAFDKYKSGFDSTVVKESTMEDWLKSKGFEEVTGVWYRFGNLSTMYAYVDEDLNWSVGYNKGKRFSSSKPSKSPSILDLITCFPFNIISL